MSGNSRSPNTAWCTAAGDRIDALANVAGINDDFSPAGETTDAVWDRVIATNLTAPFKLMRAVLPVMEKASRGSILNVSSEAGLRGNASGNASGNAYTASKHGIIGVTRSAAVMYGPKGIRVNSVAPGGWCNRRGSAYRASARLTTPSSRSAVRRESGGSKRNERKGAHHERCH